MNIPSRESVKQARILANIMAQPYLLLMLAPMFWGGNIVAGRLAVGQINPQILLIGRWLGATLILLAIALPHVKRDWPKLRESLWLLGLFGIFGFACFNILLYNAAHFTSAINISIENGAIPVFVLLGNFLFFSVRAKRRQILGLVLTLIGIVWVATGGEPKRLLSLNVNIGDGMVLLACLFYAAYSLTLRFRPDIHWLSFLFVTTAAALLASITFQLTVGGGLFAILPEIQATTALGWTCVLYVMIFPSILSQLFFARGVELIGANRASIFINLIPVMGTLLAVLILGETFKTYHLVASALVLAGIMLSEYTTRRHL